MKKIIQNNKIVKKFLCIFFLIICASSACSAADLNGNVPSYFPKKLPTIKAYTCSAFIEAFYEKWAESISENNKIKIKLYDTKYNGIYWREEISDNFVPKMLIKNTENNKNISCNLYTGILGVQAYRKLKTPLLYDSKHNICVAVIGIRDYSNTEYPFFEEPKDMQKKVSIYGYFPNIKQDDIILNEIALIPANIEEKKIDKYVKLVKKTYNKILRAEESARIRAYIKAQNELNRQPSYLDNPVDLGTKLLQGGAAYGLEMLFNAIK